MDVMLWGRKLIRNGGAIMNIIIDNDTADYIRKNTQNNSVTLLMMTTRGG